MVQSPSKGAVSIPFKATRSLRTQWNKWATLEWTANSVTCTGPKDGKLKAIDVNMNAMPDAAMTR